jgi:UDP-GlcNAc:undecaprenyl-phosphate GlcNAc-1-phosphate transferase
MLIKNVLLMVLIPLLFNLVFIPIVRIIANHIGALDIPNERKVHKKPIPRLGGLGIYCSFLLGYMIFGKESIQMNSILIGSFIIVITGMIDDIKPIPAKYKFLGQLAAASIVAFYGNILLRDISALGIYINFGIFSYPITILFIVSVINCINLIDGLDGLAGGIASIYFLTIGVIALMLNNSNGLDIILTFVMLGSTLGFLYHNFNPASIFMGDSGSMFLGYMISVIALLGFKNITLTSFIIPILLLAVPIMDTAFAILRRIINHKPISMPDKNHLHHQFLRMNFSQKTTVLIIYLIDFLFAIASIIYVLGDSMQGIIIYIILFILVIILINKTDIIFNHSKNKSNKE